MTRLQRYLAIPRRERRAVTEAVVLLAITPGALRVCGVRRSLAWATRAAAALDDARWSAARITQLIESIATELPWRTTCLHRALAAAWMMRRRGIPCEITIGVRHGDDGFAAHAWIPDPLGRTATDRYAPLISWRTSGLPDRR